MNVMHGKSRQGKPHAGRACQYPQLNFRPGEWLADEIRDRAGELGVGVSALIRRSLTAYFYGLDLRQFISSGGDSNGDN